MKTTLKYVLLNLFTIMLATHAFAQDTLVTKQIDHDLSYCVRLNLGGREIIRSRTALEALIRNDNSRQACLKKLKGLNMSTISLLGINLNSGWCRAPLVLKYTAIRTDAEKKYVLVVSYDEPVEPCRALSSYDLWVAVPALPEGYQVEFVIHARRREALSD